MGPEVTWGEGEAVNSQQSPEGQGAEQDWSVGSGGKEGPGAFLLPFLSEICESSTTLLQSTRDECTKGLVSVTPTFITALWRLHWLFHKYFHELE